jgi:hypothetical protein
MRHALWASIALTTCLIVSGPSEAADLASGVVAPYSAVAVEAPRTVIVVPDCTERRWAVLLHCAPRDTVTAVSDLALSQIERTAVRPRRRPYPELVPR